jgi:molybdate transport repressor ModE-like protein
MAGSVGDKYYDIFLEYRLWLSTKKGKGILGEGRINLLKEIDRTGSLKSASENLKISYRKAWGNIKEAEELLGFKLVEKQRGGKDGGNSQLSEEGKQLLAAYDELKMDFDRSIKKITKKFFHRINEPLENVSDTND